MKNSKAFATSLITSLLTGCVGVGVSYPKRHTIYAEDLKSDWLKTSLHEKCHNAKSDPSLQATFTDNTVTYKGAFNTDLVWSGVFVAFIVPVPLMLPSFKGSERLTCQDDKFIKYIYQYHTVTRSAGCSIIIDPEGRSHDLCAVK